MSVESDLIPFIIVYIPFWTIPIIGFSFYFAKIYFKKGYRKIAFYIVWLGFISLILLLFYIFSGGPLPTLRILQNIFEKPF